MGFDQAAAVAKVAKQFPNTHFAIIDVDQRDRARRSEGAQRVGDRRRRRPYLGPQVLASAMKRVDTSVYSTIQQVLAKKFAGGTNAVFSLANNGVGLGKISSKVPKADVLKVQQIAKQVAAGTIKNIPTEVIAG